MQYECACTSTVHATIVLYYAVVANTTIDLKIFMMVIAVMVDCHDRTVQNCSILLHVCSIVGSI